MLSIAHAQKGRAYISGTELGLFVEGDWQEPPFDSGQRGSPGSTGWYSAVPVWRVRSCHKQLARTFRPVPTQSTAPAAKADGLSEGAGAASSPRRSNLDALFCARHAKQAEPRTGWISCEGSFSPRNCV